MDNVRTILGPSGESLSLVTPTSIAHPSALVNSLAPASLAPFAVNPFGFPALADFPNSPQISNINGIYDNLRWYLVSNFWQVLSQMYCEIGLVKTICQVVVDDALRGGFEITTKELDDDDIQALLNYMEENEDLVVLKETGYWNNLFGGSFTMPVTENQDPESPLNLDEFGPDSHTEFRAGDLWEVFWDYSTNNPMDYGMPMGDWFSEFYMYYGQKVHYTRLWKMKGIKAPSYIRPRLRGWGMSKIEELIRELNRFLKTQDVIFQILDDSRIDVIQFEGMIDALYGPGASQGNNSRSNIAKRADLSNAKKSYTKTAVMDAKDKYTINQASFSGFSDISKENRTELACALRIPQTKLWGDAPGGMSTTDENGMENYNGMIESEIRPTLKRNALFMIKIRCMELFGFVPKDLIVKFKSLRMISSLDEETIKTQKHDRLMASWQAGGIGRTQYLEGCNKDALFPIKVEATKLSSGEMPISSVGDAGGGDKAPGKEKPAE